MHLQTSNVTIAGTEFNGFMHTDIGAAVYSQNSNTDVESSMFRNNVADQGAGIYMDCMDADLCTYTVMDTEFTNNTAHTMGAAMAFNFYSPSLSGNTFTDNTAPYGEEVASYAKKISLVSNLAEQYVSGQAVEQPIIFQLLDVNDNPILTDTDSVLTISSVDQTVAKVIGNTDVTNAQFTDITFIAAPGTANIEYQVSSSNIDLDRLETALGITEEEVISVISVDFRECIRGEEQKNDMCNKCPQGKYSLEAGADECLICPKNTYCEGGDVIRVNEGFWRSGILSDQIHECLADGACLGDDGSTDADEIPY